MTETRLKSVRNQSIECARLVAAFFVVFIHCQRPEGLDRVVYYLGPQAVPLFFMISGYFSYQISNQKIWNRMIQILKLTVMSTLLYYAWHIFTVLYVHGDVVAYLQKLTPTPTQLLCLLLFNVPANFTHLWYLLAMAKVYLVLWLYVRFFGQKKPDYRLFYLVGIGIYLLFVLADVVLTVKHLTVYEGWYYTAVSRGLPMVALGLLLREYQEKHTRFNPILSLVVYIAGLVLLYLDWNHYSPKTTVHFGTVISMIGLMAFLTAHPVVVNPDSVFGRCITRFGFLSTFIYITHMIFLQTYIRKVQIHVEHLFPGAAPYILPFAVALMALFAAILCDIALTWAKQILKGKVLHLRRRNG